VGFYTMSALGQSLVVAVLSGGLGAAVLALVVGPAILRLRGAYFALATIGINEAARAFVANFAPFGGPTGMSLNFRVYTAYGGAMQALWLAYWVMLLLAIVSILLSFIIKSSKFGLALMAIRENEDAAEVMGVVTPRAKVWIYVISAIVPGMAGVLYFFKNGNIEPVDAFQLHKSIEIIVMVMLGGQGTVLGPLIGAGVYERLRGLLLVSPFFKNIQLAVAGVVLLMMSFHPRRCHWLAQASGSLAERGVGMILQLQGITKEFGGLRALDNISFKVPEGQILGLIGPNGAGKTTVFNVISGIFRPTSGTVRYGERDDGAAPYRLARDGYCPHPSDRPTAQRANSSAQCHGGRVFRS
jgi:branched-chain amino acid transport system permease protein